MATISRVQIGFENKIIIREIKVDSKGTFTCALPAAAAEKLGFDSVSALTLDKCESAYDDALAKYKSLKTTSRKVILYQVETQAQIMRAGKCVYSKSEFHFNDGCALAVCCGVYMENMTTAADGGKRYDYVYVRESKLHDCATYPKRNGTFSIHGEREDNQLEWTQEREDFFARLAFALESIILEVDKLKEPENLQKVIAAGSFKMLPPSK